MIKVELAEVYDSILESPTGAVMVIPATTSNLQEFGRNILNSLTYTRAQRQALRSVREAAASKGMRDYIDQLIEDAIEAERMMDAACQFIGRAIITSNLEQKGSVQ
ncbi:hypothetical protein [Pseudogemmobacter bohemicus]|uniref:hypothetical protein n=1 Tax=Pseudogemmobacter bohemicus TaxID=2250708 RepID=UPI001300A937|nr:hypothetical protein [Pseudogemmobacter bohemicus]